ncbi:MAG: hypothetical protein JNM68_11570, partial [Dinghuibacter sp.]|nr:hypothetical protein [Dinghuibacter sp.]
MKNLQRLLLPAILLCAHTVTAQLSQTRNAGTAATSATAPCGATAWINTANATGVINNGTVARTTPAVGVTPNCLELTNAGFTIPAYATITGIRVDVRRIASRTNVNDINVQLLKAGARTGGNLAQYNNWPQALTTVTYGGDGNLWGATWLPADINAANFGFSITAS